MSDEITAEEIETTEVDETPAKTFTQAEVDKLVGKARIKERGKFADYDDLKAQVAQLTEENATIKAQRDNDRARAQWVADVSKDTGVPSDVLQLMNADSLDDLKGKAEAIGPYFKKSPLPAVPGDGKTPEEAKPSDERMFVRQLLGKDQ